MPKVDFSFWEWFFGNIRFVEKCLSDAWKDGRIDGFSSSKLSAKQLHNRPVGTFLLRFSDCVIGALTPVYVARDGTIKKLTPIAFKEFEIINHGPNDPEYYGIGNLISRLEECTHFWNGMSKLEAFDKYYKSVKKSKDGYVERIDAHSRFDANPSGSSSTLYSPTTQSVESGINQSIASPSVSSSTISTLSNKIPVHNGFLPHASDGFPSDTFMAPYHLANCSPAIPFEPSQLLIPSSDNSSQPGFVSSSGFVPSPSQPQSLESGNNLTSSPGFATEPPNTVPNDNTYATGFSSNISTLPSPNFSPSIPFRPSPSPVQSQSVQFQKNFTGSPGFASPPNTVPIENTYAVGFSSFIPSPYVEPLYLPNSNSLNVTQAEYNRSVLNTPVPQPHYHNYSDDPTNHYNINSNMLPINQFNYGNASIEPHNYVNNYDNGGDISMANSNANDLNVLTLNEPFNKLWSDFNKYKK
ncbi:probable serine/threonine-protein kinase DDB_G0267686 [Contarinia nasturtii]|uniref:probable serine/threonine-protein kinase DDB_G0267686 n=1 Tax=Contarinia nasturtii TaxID=265458 RepID=UPI0012D41236|nr:probable serine/threonine-protein kinase DDB_G0267686 [Contarinia nasturtii]